MKTVEVALAGGEDLAAPLELLEECLRDAEPVPEAFAGRLRAAVEAGTLEVLTARMGDRVVGVAVLSYRLSVSTGGLFASIEDLHVRSEARRRGVGRALLETVGVRCAARGVSYVEVQTDDEAASFYASLRYELEPGVLVLSRTYAL